MLQQEVHAKQFVLCFVPTDARAIQLTLTDTVSLRSHTFVCLFGLMINAPVNSYGHVGTVSLPTHTFFLGKLEKRLTITSCT